MLARIGRTYLAVGRGAGGVLGVLAFIATWIFFIARFGLVFGGSLGWIPAAIVGMVLSAVVAWLWLPLVAVAIVMLSAPAWDRSGVVEKATQSSVAAAVRGWAWTEATIRKAAAWTRDEAAREGLARP
jgi:hypothetical protein